MYGLNSGRSFGSGLAGVVGDSIMDCDRFERSAVEQSALFTPGQNEAAQELKRTNETATTDPMRQSK